MSRVEAIDMVLPQFDSDGVLPPGDFALTFEQLRASQLVVMPAGYEGDWDSAWRLQLTQQLEVMAKQLWTLGFDDIFIDGSFVEDKGHPNDIDGYFVCDRGLLASGKLERELNKLDPFKVWTWSSSARKSVRGFAKKQLPMWITYRVELFPHFGQLSGIRDAFGNELEFPSAFRLSRRDGAPRGIVQIVRNES